MWVGVWAVCSVCRIASNQRSGSASAAALGLSLEGLRFSDFIYAKYIHIYHLSMVFFVHWASPKKYDYRELVYMHCRVELAEQWAQKKGVYRKMHILAIPLIERTELASSSPFKNYPDDGSTLATETSDTCNPANDDNSPNCNQFIVTFTSWVILFLITQSRY